MYSYYFFPPTLFFLLAALYLLINSPLLCAYRFQSQVYASLGDCLIVQLNHFSHSTALHFLCILPRTSLSLPDTIRHSSYFFGGESKGLCLLCFSVTRDVENVNLDRWNTERKARILAAFQSECPLGEAVQVKQRRLFLFSACGRLWFSLPWNYMVWGSSLVETRKQTAGIGLRG